MDQAKSVDVTFKTGDLEIKTTKGSGPGGQNRNKVETAVQIRHKLSGEKVSICMGKSQSKNKKNAKKILKERLEKKQRKKNKKQRDKERKKQVGTGMRGDKVRTIQTQSDKVTNHLNGKTMQYKKYKKGYVEELH